MRVRGIAKAPLGAVGQGVRPYYQHAGITIYHGDVRDVGMVDASLLVTDPPYPNNAGHFDDGVPVAREFLAAWQGKEALVFWSEMEHPALLLPLVAVHIWHRVNVNGRPYEPVYHFARTGDKRRSCVIGLPAVFAGAGPGCREYLGHPTQKSVPLMHWLIGKTMTEGVIFDPFMGSGTTLRAAKNLGRSAVGVDVSEAYCEIAAIRLAQEVLDMGDVA